MNRVLALRIALVAAGATLALSLQACNAPDANKTANASENATAPAVSNAEPAGNMAASGNTAGAGMQGNDGPH